MKIPYKTLKGTCFSGQIVIVFMPIISEKSDYINFKIMENKFSVLFIYLLLCFTNSRIKIKTPIKEKEK